MGGKVENDPGQHPLRGAHDTLTASFTLTIHRPGISRTTWGMRTHVLRKTWDGTWTIDNSNCKLQPQLDPWCPEQWPLSNPAKATPWSTVYPCRDIVSRHQKEQNETWLGLHSHLLPSPLQHHPPSGEKDRRRAGSGAGNPELTLPNFYHGLHAGVPLKFTCWSLTPRKMV